MSGGVVFAIAGIALLLASLGLVLGLCRAAGRDMPKPTSHRGGRARKDSRHWPHTRGH